MLGLTKTERKQVNVFSHKQA